MPFWVIAMLDDGNCSNDQSLNASGYDVARVAIVIQFLFEIFQFKKHITLL